MEKKLTNKTAAIVVADGFEESEFTKPLEALKNAGVKVDVISIKPGKVKAWTRKHWSNEYMVDKEISEAKAQDYDIVVLPGGVMKPDQLRTNKQVVDFVASFFKDGKPVAAVCHGPWTLIETGLLKGKTVTSWPSLKTDLTNAGAKWVDQEVVVDHNLITSRKPDDLPAFCEKFLAELSKGTVAKR